MHVQIHIKRTSNQLLLLMVYQLIGISQHSLRLSSLSLEDDGCNGRADACSKVVGFIFPRSRTTAPILQVSIKLSRDHIPTHRHECPIHVLGNVSPILSCYSGIQVPVQMRLTQLSTPYGRYNYYDTLIFSYKAQSSVLDCPGEYGNYLGQLIIGYSR